jgi:hypothetical protein
MDAEGDAVRFAAFSSFGGVVVRHPHLHEGELHHVQWSDLQALVDAGYLCAESRGAALVFDITPEGFDFCERA